MNALVIIGEAPNITELTGGLEPATYTSNTATMFDGGTSVSDKTLGAVVPYTVKCLWASRIFTRVGYESRCCGGGRCSRKTFAERVDFSAGMWYNEN